MQGKGSRRNQIILLIVIFFFAAVFGFYFALFNRAEAKEGDTQVKILFTHDIHSFLAPTEGFVEGEVREHGGAARLATLIKENSGEDTIYLDAGDFSQGTLFQAEYTTEAYELRMLGQLGCAVVTPGNHEWDYGGAGFAKMLRSAMASGDPLPQMVQSNLDFSGELTEEQQDVKDALDSYGATPYTLVEVNGVTLGVFGLSGIESIEDSPTSGMQWIDYIQAAQDTVAELEGKCDVIICLSHSGTSGDGEVGEDFDLIDQVPGIDVVISGHSHTAYHEAVIREGTILGSAGEYLSFLGSMTLDVAEDGTVSCADYQLIPIDASVPEDPAMAQVIAGYKASIQDGYLASYDASYDEVIARSDFDFMPLGEMYATHQEYPMGDLIADSYIYEAQKQGVDDLDVALVGLGTIRGSFFEGDITTADAFEICSLGAGSDGSAGHPILLAYVTGEELKLLTELDASLGPGVSSIKMSYSGLEYTFNEKRTILDRVTEVHLLRPDGSTEEIHDDQLYKVSCNMYAANMLGMLNGLTKGILSITPKDTSGTPIEDFYTCALVDGQGKEVKEWVAFRDYLMSFDKVDGVSTIPADYAAPQGRKVKVSEGGMAAISHPGKYAKIIFGVILALILIIVLIILLIRRGVKRRKVKKAAKKALAEGAGSVVADLAGEKTDPAEGGEG